MDELLKRLVEAKANREYWRVKYNTTYLFGEDHALAMFQMYDEEVDTILEILRTYY
jgi:hypothetical protein